jgi:hypothetical protein
MALIQGQVASLFLADLFAAMGCGGFKKGLTTFSLWSYNFLKKVRNSN